MKKKEPQPTIAEYMDSDIWKKRKVQKMDSREIIGLRFPYSGNQLRNHCLEQVKWWEDHAEYHRKNPGWFGRGNKEADFSLGAAHHFASLAERLMEYRDTTFWLDSNDRNEINME